MYFWMDDIPWIFNIQAVVKYEWFHQFPPLGRKDSRKPALRGDFSGGEAAEEAIQSIVNFWYRNWQKQ